MSDEGIDGAKALPARTEHLPAAAPGGGNGGESAWFRIKFKTIASISTTLAIGVLLTLVSVLYVRQSDALSTLALALAILSFSVQISLYLAQARDGQVQREQGLALHGQLVALVSNVDERTAGTQRRVEMMDERWIAEYLGKIAPGMPQALLEEQAEGIARMAGASAAPAPLDVTVGVGAPAPLDPSTAAAIQAELEQPVTAADFAQLKSMIEGLGDESFEILLRMTRDLRSSTRPESAFGPGLWIPPDSELVRRGIVEQVPGKSYHMLGSQGRKVARLLTAGQTPPGDELLDRFVVRARTSGLGLDSHPAE